MTFGAFVFLSPWLLAAFLALPFLWWLIKVIPPRPISMPFPAIGLLMGLDARNQDAASAPWWLVALRLLMVAALIVALARPVFDPGRTTIADAPLLLVVEDGWGAAPGWAGKIESLKDLLDKAARAKQPVILQNTAADADGNSPMASGLMDAGQARARLERLRPKSWPADHSQVITSLEPLKLNDAEIIWAGDGLLYPESRRLAERLATMGEVTLLHPQESERAIVLQPGERRGAEMRIRLLRFHRQGAQPVTILASDDAGNILARSQALFKSGERQSEALFRLPAELQNQLTHLRVEGRPEIGATLFLDERWQRRSVGIIRESTAGQGFMLLSEDYYLQRALEPSGLLSQAPVDLLLRSGSSVILLPDSAPLSEDDRRGLTDWIEKGGVLVRFAGDNLANSLADDLVPVKLRRGGRNLGGAMLWSQPQNLSKFQDTSPFAGLKVPRDALVTRQVLAEPSPDLAEKTWARLVDGTPLVTAEKRGQGWLVLFHMTANADWSNVALSGLFVDMLQRLIALSQGDSFVASRTEPLPPLRLFDGLGAPMARGGAVVAYDAFLEDQKKEVISPQHPPGFYGNDIYRVALNPGENMMLPESMLPESLTDFDGPIKFQGYQNSKSIDLSGWFLALTLILLALDGGITLQLRGRFFDRPVAVEKILGKPGGLFLLVAAVFVAPPAEAQNNSANDYFALQASLGTTLAYMITGDRRLDKTSMAGLRGLKNHLNSRTAVEASEPVGINPASDALAFFPLIYWPISATQQPLSRYAIERLNDYMANGGLLLIDTRNQETGGLDAGEDRNLNRLTRGLNIPTLQQIPPGHVLGKSFYLLREFPGRWRGHALWVALEGAQSTDGVSAMVVGGNDWAGAWAVDEGGRALYPIIPGGAEQREMAYRFGINLVMYTLTGNYKADQVHVHAILERLGQ